MPSSAYPSSTTTICLSTSLPTASTSNALSGYCTTLSTPRNPWSRLLSDRLGQLNLFGTSIVPSYTFNGDQYAALATQAAYATSLLTTSTGADRYRYGHSLRNESFGAFLPPSLSPNDTDAPVQPLSPEGHVFIAETLLDWAGLHGPHRQADALRVLQRHKAGIQPSNSATAGIFPPDFAAVYTRILAELHADIYQQYCPQFAERATSIGAFESRLADGATRLKSDISELSEPLSSDDIADRACKLGVPYASLAIVLQNAAAPGQGRSGSTSKDAVLRAELPIADVDAGKNSWVGIQDLLRFAHHLYQSGTCTSQAPDGTVKNELHPSLLPLLKTLAALHPHHLPTLLLLSCAYYSIQDLRASLFWNLCCLQVEPGYVEAMSNIGTTLRSMGRTEEAKTWWERALTLRPTYWDAFENLLGLTCAQAQQQRQYIPAGRNGKNDETLRWRQALELCEHVESNILSTDLSQGPSLPPDMRASNVPRLQQLLYSKGILKTAISSKAASGCLDYMRAIEIVISPSTLRCYTFRDLIVAATVAAIVIQGTGQHTQTTGKGVSEVLSALGLDIRSNEHLVGLVATAQWHRLCAGGLLELVKRAGEPLVHTLIHFGGGEYPTLLLVPEQALRIPSHLFADFDDELPSMASARAAFPQESGYDKALLRCKQTSTTILLTLAKVLQEAIASPALPQEDISIDGLRPCIALVLILHYLSTALHSMATTYSNLAILCAGLNTMCTSVAGGSVVEYTAAEVAMKWYDAGIELDPKTPHLACNKASLLKDMGKLNEAIVYYQIAIKLQPRFAIALANLGNVYRDQSRTEEAIEVYKQALEVEPEMPEALCGLLNATIAIADWSLAYSDDREPGNGLLVRVAQTLVERQLDAGASYGRGAFSASFTLQSLIERICWYTNDTREHSVRAWHRQLLPFFDGSIDAQGDSLKLNEGGFLLRLVDYLHHRLQHRWYCERFGNILHEDQQTAIIQPSQADALRYPRIRLLASVLGLPAAPLVLPFHTFFTAIEGVMSVRALRLLAHRNSLRISHIGNSQHYLPSHIYPPPPPPAPRTKVGYISSDIKDHPLSHLLQSMFSMHNRQDFEVFIYSTSPSDHSSYRTKIESEAEPGHFIDVSNQCNGAITDQVLKDGIHLMVNLNGYTKGAKNEIFASRIAPVQLHFMGFAGGMASSWTDYTIVDATTCPPEVTSTVQWNARRRAGQGHRSLTSLPGEIDPEELSHEWVYTEKFIAMPHSYFVNNHRQDSRESPLHERPSDQDIGSEELWEEEEERRWRARKELFPGLPDHFVCFASFNQHYKSTPALLKCWLRILQAVPNSILWLLEFPKAATPYILRDARKWAGDEVASRLVFTPIAPKAEFIRRARVADIVLDSFEVNAHTTACDALWSGTPVLTLPKWRMKQASMVASGIVMATGYGKEMIVDSEAAYVQRAIELTRDLGYDYVDACGQVLEPIMNLQQVTASELTRLGDSARKAGAAATSSSVGPTAASSLPASSASSVTSAVPSVPCSQEQVQKIIEGLEQGAPPSTSAKQEALNARVAASAPPRHQYHLLPGPQAPPSAVSRRGRGALISLRKALFLGRETSPLFDTRKWVQDLERGYREAWRRWVEGTDCEESPAWDALSEEMKARKSGHIFVADLIREEEDRETKGLR